MNQFKRYYVTAHTASGFVNYLESNIKNVKKVIVLDHPSYKLKTDIFKRATTYFNEIKTIDILCHPLSTSYLEGIIFGNSLAIVSEEIASNLTNKHTISLSIGEELNKNTNALHAAHRQYRELASEAYTYFSKGLNIHDELENVYIKEMDFEKADDLANTFTQNLLQSVKGIERESYVYHRLFGTNTSDGVVNELPSLIEGVEHRVFVKGRAGTGKSVFMKKVMNACQQKGFDIEFYHCSFDPNSVDMIMVPELNFCIFDSTPPHEFFPNRKEDVVIDLYEKTVTPGTDEKFATEISRLTNQYKAEMKEGIEKLKIAGTIVKKEEEAWTKGLDFSNVWKLFLKQASL